MASRFRLTAGFRVRFSDDGALLVCTGSNVVMNDIVKHERLWVSRALKHPSNIDFSPDGKMLAVKNTMGRIVILDTRSGEVIHDHKVQKGNEGCQPHFSVDGKEFVDSPTQDVLNVKSDVLTVKQTINDGVIGSREVFPFEMIQRISHDIHRQAWLLQHHFRGKPAGHDSHNGYVSIHEWPFNLNASRVLRFPLNITNATLSPDGKLFCFSEICPAPTLRIARVSDGEIIARSNPLVDVWANEMVWSFDGSLIGTVERRKFAFYRTSDLSLTAEVPATYPSSIAFRPGTQEIALGTWNTSIVVPLSAVMQGLVKMK